MSELRERINTTLEEGISDDWCTAAVFEVLAVVDQHRAAGKQEVDYRTIEEAIAMGLGVEVGGCNWDDDV